MSFCLHEVLFKSLFHFRMMGGFRHLGKRARQLHFCMEKILQLVDKQFFNLWHVGLFLNNSSYALSAGLSAPACLVPSSGESNSWKAGAFTISQSPPSFHG